MLNAFDSSNYPSGVPTTLVRGMRWAWRDGSLLGTYPAATYSWRWVARPEGGVTANQGEVAIAGSDSGEYVLFEVGSATTKTYLTGRYRWQIQVTRTSDSETVTVLSGIALVAPNVDEDTSDRRSSARVALEHLEDYERGNRSPTVVNYSIGGRSVGHMTAEERIRLTEYYRRRVADEDIKARRARGDCGAGQIRVWL